ncbi:hypothetical protein B0T10DRAFT_548048 [Thelonectria olida]|uniref:Uncharacterized protein n=1 Tax=Thelonectria olida TaxID=1576542 RepID=A0A9P8W6J1_9HYPO|nr:hypothetical protein B0T10DRAFT_548048 [Thelonectria olida]
MAPIPKAGAIEGKSPKLPRRFKTPERQVHFGAEDEVPSSYANRAGPSLPPVTQGGNVSYTTANSPSGGFSGHSASTGGNTSGNDNKEAEPQPSNQPESFPQVGLAPTNNFVQWHTAANPNLSLNHQLPTTHTYNPAATAQQHQQQILVPSQQQHFSPSATNTAPLALHTQQQQPAAVTYIGIQHQPRAAMGDYQNAAPPPQGVHFQPPVPDTTFGPIPHVYVPRFDGGLVAGGVQVPGVQVGAPFSLPVPSVHFVSAPFPSVPSVSAPCTTVVMPKTYYLNPYSYYASRACRRSCQPAAGVIHPQQAQSGYVVAQQPYYVQQPAVVGQQPVVMNAQTAFMPQAQHMAGVPAVGLASGAAIHGGIPVIAGNPGYHIPDVAGVGRTAGEEQLRQIKFAHSNRLYEPQDFKPADDDPGRHYWLREVDGNWTQRSRHTLDHIGDIRCRIDRQKTLTGGVSRNDN